MMQQKKFSVVPLKQAEKLKFKTAFAVLYFSAVWLSTVLNNFPPARKLATNEILHRMCHSCPPAVTAFVRTLRIDPTLFWSDLV